MTAVSKIMKKKSIVLTLFLLMIVLFSGCIQQKVAGNETLSNKNEKTSSVDYQIGNDVFSNKTLMFEMKIPAGWKDDAM
jgi:PBP1b-binding outer membrane lipoprotein LpoB